MTRRVARVGEELFEPGTDRQRFSADPTFSACYLAADRHNSGATVAANPLAPFTCPKASAAPLPPSSWMTIKAIFEGSTSLRFEVGEPADLRLTLTISGGSVSATGIDDVGELIEGFQLDGEAIVFCDRSSFTLVQTGDTVIYRDAEELIPIPRGAYDRVAALVTDLIQDRHVQDVFEEACLRLAKEAREAAWLPSHDGL
ncbi:hypothetical protein A5481_11450 [Methylobacterium platani]|uniref:Uncharacterized protein n=2 Tax=Methylobacterium platani TaxID=427683 RepID=A0A179SBT3_9HYPH|nr:hypothetical protein A5481_11450 [Methylobacterium platani]